MLVDESERIQQIALSALTPNPEQPRTVFDETALSELADSIRQFGIVQPLVVTPAGGSAGALPGAAYHIIAGERRWRAAGLAGLRTVPAVVRTAQQQEKLELAILENVQRVDLSPLEQAVSIERLHQQFNLSYDEIGKRLGKAMTTVHNTARLLQLPQDARDALAAGDITEGHARQILALKSDTAAQTKLLQLIVSNGWSVRQTERYVLALKAGAKEPKAAQQRVSGDTPETERLSQRYGAKVRIHRTAHGGRVEIAFGDDEQLAKLLADLEH